MLKKFKGAFWLFNWNKCVDYTSFSLELELQTSILRQDSRLITQSIITLLHKSYRTLRPNQRDIDCSTIIELWLSRHVIRCLESLNFTLQRALLTFTTSLSGISFVILMNNGRLRLCVIALGCCTQPKNIGYAMSEEISKTPQSGLKSLYCIDCKFQKPKIVRRSMLKIKFLILN